MPKKSLAPLLILASGFLWYGLTAWVRRQSWFRKGQPEGGTNENALVLIGLFGLLVCMAVAAVAAYQKW